MRLMTFSKEFLSTMVFPTTTSTTNSSTRPSRCAAGKKLSHWPDLTILLLLTASPAQEQNDTVRPSLQGRGGLLMADLADCMQGRLAAAVLAVRVALQVVEEGPDQVFHPVFGSVV